ncbi:putative integral membrane protein (TIGR00698 family) [Bisgaardia hudsonensis]|uniref:Putative integral membrane protein (TIGR00698 family) n=1 Tax=Bisgaardia hudsonensis TaxID=109472 RepID=A0A4R2MZV7_9PAST|nr:YeiH family protein [Bisgaardia hudsonensis]QLB13812.1 hypothetical protein A6A11_09420 [Bisgaardia hudsonensis]TCP11705.1 putative integral membrane protein (TIGR00698 family) [Bisgaardia hudsonensis]
MELFKSAKNYIPKRPHFLGIVATLVWGLFCLWINQNLSNWTNGHTFGMSSLTLAILIGILIGNTFYSGIEKPLSAGVGFVKGQILRLAIMLYGVKLTFIDVASVGMPAIFSDVLILSFTFLLTYWLGIKLLKMDKQITILMGAGASICGAAAVIATEPVVKPEPYKVTIAVATVVVFGTIAMLVYPMLYQIGWLQPWLSTQDYGIYIGSTVHEVAQVVVAGNAVDTSVTSTAVITKMIRVMMLAPFLLVLSFVLVGNQQSQEIAFNQRVKQLQVPWFAFIFIFIVLLNTWLSLPKNILSVLVFIDNLLLTMAMFALGLTTHLSAIKQAGIKPLILGAIIFVWLVVGGGLVNVIIQSIFG